MTLVSDLWEVDASHLARGYMSKDQRFQVMPSLGEEEYQKLKESIAERGVLIPIEKDADTGEILDGFHRLRVCEELGIEPPVVERHFDSDADRKIHALTLNLARRQLGPVSWAKAFEELLEVQGVKTGSGARNDQTSRTVREVAREQGVSEDTAGRRLKLARDLEDHPEVADAVDRGEITPMEARRRVGVAPPKQQSEGAKSSDVVSEGPEREPTIGELFERHGLSMDDMPRRSEEEKAFFPIQIKAREIRCIPASMYGKACPRVEYLDDAIENLEELITWAEEALKALKEERRQSTQLRAVK